MGAVLPFRSPIKQPSINMVSLRIIIAVVAFSAIVVLGQEKEKEQKNAAGGDSKLLFNLGTRTFVFISTKVVTRWSTCTQGAAGARPSPAVTQACAGKRRRRALSPKSPQLEAISDLAASDLASSVDTESKVIENDDKGKLGFFSTVKTTITITSTKIDTATTVSVSIECQTSPASSVTACTG